MFKVLLAKESITKPVHNWITSEQGGTKQEKILDTHYTQLEQFIKLTTKLMLKVDPNEEARE
jgi:hypothetical protein